jgi:hypothetical protein
MKGKMIRVAERQGSLGNQDVQSASISIWIRDTKISAYYRAINGCVLQQHRGDFICCQLVILLSGNQWLGTAATAQKKG